MTPEAKNNRETSRNISRKLKNLKSLASVSRGVEIGWFEDAPAYPDGSAVAAVARIQEFGNDKIPPRPFMRPTAREGRETYRAMLLRGMKSAAQKGADINKTLQGIGAAFAKDLRHTINRIWTPPLAKYTVEKRRERKGSNASNYALLKPLVDTRRMIDSIKFETYER